MPNENYRESDILGGISYLSVFFAPVLFPLIVDRRTTTSFDPC